MRNDERLIRNINRKLVRERKRHRIIISSLLFIGCLLSIVAITAISTSIQYKNELVTVLEERDKLADSTTLYKGMYQSMVASNKEITNQISIIESELSMTKTNLTTALEEVDKYKLSIELNESKLPEYRNLTIFEPMTEEELNDWIANKAPSSSPFIGQAEVFLSASEETGLDPKYIVAHAGVESAWGTSSLAKNKGNYFGIGAYNSSPSSAFRFASNGDDKLAMGIINGAAWIKEHYINKGKTSLHDFLYKGAAYAQYDDGSPNTGWLYNIASIIK